MTIHEAFSSTPANLGTAASYTAIPGLSLTPGAGSYLALFVMDTTYPNPAGDEVITTAIFVNGVIAAHTERELRCEGSLDAANLPMGSNAVITLAAGQSVDVRYTNTGSGTVVAGNRRLVLFPASVSDLLQASATATTTTSSATDVLLGSMTLTPGAGTYLLNFSTTGFGPADAVVSFTVYVNGVAVAHTNRTMLQEASIPAVQLVCMINASITVSAGQAVEIRWSRAGGAGTITSLERTLTLMRIPAAQISQATATADSTSTSTTDAIISGMSITPTTLGGIPYLALFSASDFYGTIGVNEITTYSFYRGSVQATASELRVMHEASIDNADLWAFNVATITPLVSEAVTARWRGSPASNTRTIRERTLTIVREAIAFAAVAAITGGGALAATGIKKASSAVSAGGGGAIAAVVSKNGKAQTAIAADGVLAAVGNKKVTATASTAADGAVSSTATKSGEAGTSMSGDGAVEAAISKGGRDAVSIAGDGALATESAIARFVNTAVAGDGEVITEVEVAVANTARVSGGGALETTATHDGFVATQVSGDGALQTANQKNIAAAVDISDDGAVVSTGRKNGQSGITASGDGNSEAQGDKQGVAAIQVPGDGALDVAASKQAFVLALVNGDGATETAGFHEGFTEVVVEGGGEPVIQSPEDILAFERPVTMKFTFKRGRMEFDFIAPGLE